MMTEEKTPHDGPRYVSGDRERLTLEACWAQWQSAESIRE
jgi:hypothetical protein